MGSSTSEAGAGFWVALAIWSGLAFCSFLIGSWVVLTDSGPAEYPLFSKNAPAMQIAVGGLVLFQGGFLAVTINEWRASRPRQRNAVLFVVFAALVTSAELVLVGGWAVVYWFFYHPS